MKARYVIIGGGGKEIHKILKSMIKLNISPGLRIGNHVDFLIM